MVEIITNETAKILHILAKQYTKVHNPIYQNRLPLDYILASEVRVCGKFSLRKCCLQIDDKGKVIEEITDSMRKEVHFPVQKWKGWSPNELFGGWFSTFRGFKTLTGMIHLI